MENFVFENKTRFYFGKGQLEAALSRELAGARHFAGEPVTATQF